MEGFSEKQTIHISTCTDNDADDYNGDDCDAGGAGGADSHWNHGHDATLMMMTMMMMID